MNTTLVNKGSVTDLANMNEFHLQLMHLTDDSTFPIQQVNLLLCLYVHGTVNQGDLEELTGVKRSSNSRNIAKLGMGEQAWAATGPQLVENYEDLQNRRLKMVRLTAKGKALLDECWKKSFGKNKER